MPNTSHSRLFHSSAWLVVSIIAVIGASRLIAEPVPHPDRPDRLVETRDGVSVEYSPGQEAWMKMAFETLRSASFEPTVATPRQLDSASVVAGSARDLRERRNALLAEVARQIGLPAATELQGRAFDTFLGYYDMLAEAVRFGAESFPSTFSVRRLAIWHRDDLIKRLRAGEAIEGMTYDPGSDSGRFDFNQNSKDPQSDERFVAIRAAIDAQRLKHSFSYNKDVASASFTLNVEPDTRAPNPHASDTASGPREHEAASAPIFPVVYRGDFLTPPTSTAFDFVGVTLRAAATSIADKAVSYRDATVVGIILHETAEAGLIENIISSPDRRWLCDGTSNYVAWRVARDLIGPDFAGQVYDLDAQLRIHASAQPRIDLARWAAAEKQQTDETDTELNRARYAFATRVMFMLTARHGEDALASVWRDVARTPKGKVSAKTFATAYRKRFHENLDSLIAAAEGSPIPEPATTPNPR